MEIIPRMKNEKKKNNDSEHKTTNNKRKNYPDQEGIKKEKILNNYRPITCLATMLNYLTVQIREETSYLFERTKKMSQKNQNT